MLAQTLVLIAIVAIFATSAIAGIAGYTRVETATAAKALLAPSIDAALGRYEQTVIAPAIAASFVAGDGSAPPAASSALNGGAIWPAQQLVLAPVSPSPLSVLVTITPTASSVPACRPAGGGVNSGPDIEQAGQCSPFVQESRLSLIVAADAGPASGATSVTPLAHGRVTVTLRLFAQAPYVMVAGIENDPAPGDPHEADTAGYGNALGTFSPATDASDTTIHVIYACTPAPPGDCSASDPLPADRPTSLPWTNGNAN